MKKTLIDLEEIEKIDNCLFGKDRNESKGLES